MNDPIYNDPVFGSERFEFEAQKELTEDQIIEGQDIARNPKKHHNHVRLSFHTQTRFRLL